MTIKGFKFLTPWGTTEGRSTSDQPCKRGQKEATVYILPRPDQKWGDWMTHPEPPDEPDGEDCGYGTFHIMKLPDARYAPNSWHIWYAEIDVVMGESDQKARGVSIRLRRIRPEVFARMIRLGWCRGAYLTGANLTRADLRGADLTGANLTGAIGYKPNAT